VCEGKYKALTLDTSFHGILDRYLEYLSLSPDFHNTTEFLLDLVCGTFVGNRSSIGDNLESALETYQVKLGSCLLGRRRSKSHLYDELSTAAQPLLPIRQIIVDSVTRNVPLAK